MSFGARARIRLDALRSNFNLVRNAATGSRVLAAVKANGYGHGLITVSRALHDADGLAVARLAEATRLREAGIETDIVLMGGVVGADELKRAVDLRCGLVVHTESQIALLEAQTVSPMRVWLKIDTGMRRLGVSVGAAPSLIERLRASASVGELGIMTHLANADDTSDSMSTTQFQAFSALTDGFEGDVSVANSAALLGWRDHVVDQTRWNNTGEVWIRPGLSLYGISPLTGRSASELGLLPVMQFETTLIDVKSVAAGEPVGYGGTWHATRDTLIGIAAAGYGDGYPRHLPSGTPVLVNGRRVPLAGVVSMDLLAVDLGGDSVDAIGDPVLLWGEGLPVEEIAMRGGTIPYTLVTGVIDRAGELC